MTYTRKDEFGNMGELYNLLINTPDFKKYFADFIHISQDKTIASMSLRTIQERNSDGEMLLQKYAQRHELICQKVENCFSVRKGHKKHTGIFMYHQEQLKKELVEHQQLLNRYNIPTHPSGYIEWIGQNPAYVNTMPEVEKMICRLYNTPSTHIIDTQKPYNISAKP